MPSIRNLRTLFLCAACIGAGQACAEGESTNLYNVGNPDGQAAGAAGAAGTTAAGGTNGSSTGGSDSGLGGTSGGAIGSGGGANDSGTQTDGSSGLGGQGGTSDGSTVLDSAAPDATSSGLPPGCRACVEQRCDNDLSDCLDETGCAGCMTADCASEDCLDDNDFDELLGCARDECPAECAGACGG